ncbi:hypothetical protein TeGR_g11970 [Tetraparma gracilis]|uniref:EF-hand domain-containing protein n=1 Tax=Tetraparma gracilis TaxID=2962635 RepID=A0ABQ6MVK3_9STRA|nr:hypothetical protein TeGR_g11970 [Tetraparma gracilis]
MPFPPSPPYTVSLPIPNFATSLKLLATDGIRYLPPAPQSVHVTYCTADGGGGKTVHLLHDEATGKKTQIGEEERPDPQELEKALRSRMGAPTPDAEPEPDLTVEVDAGLSSAVASVQVTTVLTVRPGSEDVIRGFLAEADVVGKSLGMGNMEIGEARQAFDTFDVEMEGTNLVPFEDLGRALVGAGFPLDVEDLKALIGEFVESLDKGGVRMGEFIRMYDYLDKEEEGINMV